MSKKLTVMGELIECLNGMRKTAKNKDCYDLIGGILEVTTQLLPNDKEQIENSFLEGAKFILKTPNYSMKITNKFNHYKP